MKPTSLFLIFLLFLSAPLIYAQNSPDGIQERRMIEQVIRQGQSALQHPSVDLATTVSHKDELAGLRTIYNAFTEARYFRMNGNQIVGNIYDYGGIAPGMGLFRNYDNMVWHGLGDIYQFGPLVAGAVIDKTGANIHFSSDAINDIDARDIKNPGDQHVCGWRALPEYVDPSSKVMASNPAEDENPKDGKPDSWPRAWYNDQKGQYVWPGYLHQDVPNADLEVLWGMDDKNNDEYPYYPFPNDTTIRGLGVKVEARALQWNGSIAQWSGALAQNCIFFIYTVQNYSPKDLDSVYFGMYGDVDVGGGVGNNLGGEEDMDDLAYFIAPIDSLHRASHAPVPVYSRSIVYFWDANGLGYQNRPTHYDACKFLESPGNSGDNLNNDGDYTKNTLSMVDESQTNGIDDDGDWNPKTDDVGIDGVPGTHDAGEGDGVPTAGFRLPDGTLDPLQPGEPNFELTDLDESDQIGLTAFRSFTYNQIRLRDDEVVWSVLEDKFNKMDQIPAAADIAFIYGSGKIPLKKMNTDGSIKRFSIALLMGWNLDELLITARTVQLIYNQNYQFVRPPDKPVVTAVPGDHRVTLYWDAAAEESFDPLSMTNDFEGYKIYRSEDHTFSDVFTITDGMGNPFLGKALIDPTTKKAAQWHLPWSDSLQAVYIRGFHPVEYPEKFVKYYMGDPADRSGLRHQYVDSTVTDGKTYYYAVVAFDHGSNTASLKLPPAETPCSITFDSTTHAYKYDVNTVAVIPGSQFPGDGVSAEAIQKNISITHTQGNGTGSIQFHVLNPSALQNSSYEVSFRNLKSGSDSSLVYNVLRKTPVSETILGREMVSVELKQKNIALSTLKVLEGGIAEIDRSLIRVDSASGLISGAAPGVLKNNQSYLVTYQYYPVVNSAALAGQDNNPVFDGIRPFVTDEALALDSTHSDFQGTRPTGVLAVMKKSSIGTPRPAPFDIKVTFTKSLGDTTASGAYTSPVDSLMSVSGATYVKVPFKVENATDTTTLSVLIRDARANGRWDLGDEIIVRTPKPYALASNNTIMGIMFTSSADGAGSEAPVLPAGTIYLAKTKRPFAANDIYTVAAKALTPVEKENVEIPTQFALSQNYPNPFNPSTTIGYNLPMNCLVRLTVYNVLGQKVVELVNAVQSAGVHRVAWNAGVASGMYFYRLEATGQSDASHRFVDVKKMLLLR